MRRDVWPHRPHAKSSWHATDCVAERLASDPTCLLGSGSKEGRMLRLRHTVEQIFTKLRQVEVAVNEQYNHWWQVTPHTGAP